MLAYAVLPRVSEFDRQIYEMVVPPDHCLRKVARVVPWDEFCALRARCMKKADGKHGRTVCKTDYQVEHARARQKATTSQDAEVRREHPKVERKLGEVMNRHNGRHARYRGRWKVLIQELMACTATNVKRLVRLFCAPGAEISTEA